MFARSRYGALGLLNLGLALVACGGAPSRQEVRDVVNAFHQAHPDAAGCLSLDPIIPASLASTEPFAIGEAREIPWIAHLEEEGLFQVHQPAGELRDGSPEDHWVLTEKGRRYLQEGANRCLKYAHVAVAEVSSIRSAEHENFWDAVIDLRYSDLADWIRDPSTDGAPGVMEAKAPTSRLQRIVFAGGSWWVGEDDWPRGPE